MKTTLCVFCIQHNKFEFHELINKDFYRFVISGDVPVGKIHLRDPSSLTVTHTLDAHSGALSDFDVHGHHVSYFQDHRPVL